MSSARAVRRLSSVSSNPASPNPTVMAERFWAPAFRAAAARQAESVPPLKNNKTGTSETKWFRKESTSTSARLAASSLGGGAAELCGSSFQYGFVRHSASRQTPVWPGASGVTPQIAVQGGGI